MDYLLLCLENIVEAKDELKKLNDCTIISITNNKYIHIKISNENSLNELKACSKIDYRNINLFDITSDRTSIVAYNKYINNLRKDGENLKNAFNEFNKFMKEKHNITPSKDNSLSGYEYNYMSDISTCYSRNFFNTINILICFVSSPSDSFSLEDQSKIKSSINDATDKICSLFKSYSNKESLLFNINCNSLPINVDVKNKPNNFEDDKYWIEAALNTNCVKKFKSNYNTCNGFVIFYSKYPVFKDAYATEDYVAIHIPQNDDYLAGLFMHEVCHIFGAKDEDSISNNCVMGETSDFTLCMSTRNEVGW